MEKVKIPVDFNGNGCLIESMQIQLSSDSLKALDEYVLEAKKTLPEYNVSATKIVNMMFTEQAHREIKLLRARNHAQAKTN